MRNLVVTVNERDYLVGCPEGEEPRIEDLSKNLDERVKELAQSIGQIGDARLLVIAGLMMLDEIKDLESRIAFYEGENPDGPDSDNEFGTSSAQDSIENQTLLRLTDALNSAANRLDRLTGQFETSFDQDTH